MVFQRLPPLGNDFQKHSSPTEVHNKYVYNVFFAIITFFCPLKNNIQQSIETPIGRVQPTSPSGHTGMKNGRTGYERDKENNYF